MKIIALVMSAFVAITTSGTEIVAHRGANNIAPENTMPAFDAAWKNGVDIVEGDFYLLSDNNIICIHSATELQKFWGLDIRDCDIAKCSLSEFKNLKIAGKNSEKFPDAKIPTLDEIFSKIPSDRGKIFAEIKCAYSDEFADKFDEVRKKCGLSESQIKIISFSQKTLKNFKLRYPKYETFLLTTMAIRQKDGSRQIRSPEQIICACKNCNADGVDIGDSKLVTKDIVDKLKAANLQFHVWTVNDPSEFERLVSIGVDSVTSDIATELSKRK